MRSRCITVLLLSILLLCFLSIHKTVSQDYTAFEWDVLAVGIGAQYNNGAGLTVSTEPRYNINNNYSISTRLELFTDFYDSCGHPASGASFSIFGDYYYFNSRYVRVFGGLGVGVLTGIEYCDDPLEVYALGLSARVGMNLSFIRISATYNQGLSNDVSMSYGGVSAGINLGGWDKSDKF